MKAIYDVVVLGDTNLDYVGSGRQTFTFASLVENGLLCRGDVDEVPGGSGLNFCNFAREEGLRPLLLSKVGDDMAGSYLTRWLQKRDIGLATDWVADAPTGKSIIVRDSADIRFLLNTVDNANYKLSIADVERHRDDIAACRVLYISGYCLSNVNTLRFQAALHAMQLAKSTGGGAAPTVVFDVVPHKIYDTFSFGQFREHTKAVDILISEVATMRRFLGIGTHSETIDTDMAMETAELVSKHYRRSILRYGRSGCDEQIAVDSPRGLYKHEETGHQEADDKRGFGDKLAIKTLRTFFDVLPA